MTILYLRIVVSISIQVIIVFNFILVLMDLILAPVTMANLLSATASPPIPPPPDGAPPSYLIPLTLTRSDLEPETARAEDDHLINVAAAHIVQQLVAKALNVVNGDLATVLFAESNVAKAQLAVCNTVSAGDGIEATALTIDMDSVSEDDILRDVSLEMECTTSERNILIIYAGSFVWCSLFWLRMTEKLNSY